MTKPTPIADRIAAALQASETTSAEITTLLADAGAEKARLAAQRADAEKTALSPLTTADGARKAKDEVDSLDFLTSRLEAGIGQLQNRLAAAQDVEEQARRWAAYDAAVAERDALVQDVRETYPELARRLAKMMARIAASDAALAQVNANRPRGAEWISPVETVTRGIDQMGFRNGSPVGSLVVHTILPDFEPSGKFYWTRATDFRLPLSN